MPIEPAAPTAGAVTIVGRAREQSELATVLDRARRGRGSMVWLAGEPGIGKSTIAEDLTVRAFEAGFRTLWGTSWQGDGAPAFWPWLQVLRQLAEQLGGEGVREVFGHAADELGPFADKLGLHRSSDEVDRFRAFDALSTGLLRLAERQPVLIVLDDLHWADTGSLEMLRFMSRDLRAAPLVLVGAYRDVEVDAAHPLSLLLGRAGSDPMHVQLLPLDRGGVEELVRLTIGREASGSFAAGVAADAGGNPFFIRELARLMNDRSGSRTLPSSLRQVVLDRVASLPHDSVELLRAASLVGITFALSDVATLTGATTESVLDALQPAVSARLVEADESGAQYNFAHALVAEVLYAELSPAVRAQQHALLAAAMERMAHIQPRMDARAHHWARAVPVAGVEPAISAAVAAAAECMQLLAHEQAAEHLQRAIAFSSQRSSEAASAESCADLYLQLGRAQLEFADRTTVAVTRAKAAHWARIAERPDLIAAAGLSLGLPFIGIAPDPGEVEILEDALQLLPADDSPIRARVMARLSAALLFSADGERRKPLAAGAVAMARRSGDPAALSYALLEQANGTWAMADTEQRLAMTNEVIALAEQCADRPLGLQARLVRLGTLLMIGDGRSFRVEVDAFDRITTLARSRVHTRITPLLKATIAQLNGEWTKAESLIGGAGSDAERAGDVGEQLAGMAALGALMHARGQVGDAPEAFAIAARQFPHALSLVAAAGLIDAGAGRLDVAHAAIIRVAADGFGDVPRDYTWLATLYDSALVAVMARDVDIARAAHDQLIAFRELVAIGSRSGVACLGPVAIVLGLTAEMLGQLDESVEHFTTAVAVSERLGAPVSAADARWALARVLDTRSGAGDAERAAGYRASASRIAAEFGVDLPLNGTEPSTEPHASPIPAGASGDAGRPLARRDEDMWTLTFSGDTVRVRHSVGLDHLANLLAAPKQERHVLELSGGWGAGQRPTVRIEVLDDAAKQAYRTRIAELQNELDRADESDDPARSARAQSELDALTAELRRSMGIGGRDRLLADDNERARVAVTKALRSAIRRISERQPSIGQHLESSIRTGIYCSYVGETPWRVERKVSQ